MGEPLFAGAATLAIYAALTLRSRAMLAASIISLITFITYYAKRDFAESVGWPLLQILFGFIILLAGFVFAPLSARIGNIHYRKPSGLRNKVSCSLQKHSMLYPGIRPTRALPGSRSGQGSTETR